MDDQPQKEPPSEAESEEIERSDLRPPDARRLIIERTPSAPSHLAHQRLLFRVALAAITITLIVLLFLSGGASSWLRSLVSPPLATLTSGSNRFYLEAGVSSARITLDGRSIMPPRIGAEPPLTLARGPHHLQWRAAPFLSQSCQFTVPASPNDTCVVLTMLIGEPSSPSTANLVLLGESLATLPSAQRTSLMNTLQAALTYNETVQPGERYFGPQGEVTATEPLSASLVFHLDLAPGGATINAASNLCYAESAFILTSDYSCSLMPGQCSQLCTIPASLVQQAGVTVSPSPWYIVVFATLTWSFATADGKTIAANVPISQGGQAVADFALFVAITWDGAGWQAQPYFAPAYQVFVQRINERLAPDNPVLEDAPGCAAMSDFIGPNAISGYSQVRFIAAENPAQGCLAMVTLASADGMQQTSAPVAYYLYRFGLLLAANSVAHHYTPAVPQPNAYEFALAQQLAAQPSIS